MSRGFKSSAAPKVLVAFLIVMATTLCGCLGSSRVPVHRYYRLPVAEKPSPSGPALPVVLRVEEFDVRPAYDHMRLVYRLSPYEMRHYGFRQWVAKPGRLVSDALRDFLRFSGRFRSVTDQPRPMAQYTVSGMIEAIEEVDGPKGKRWYAHLAMTVRLKRSSDGEVVWERRFDKMARVRRRHPVHIVAGLTRILREAAESSMKQIIEAIRSGKRAGR